MQKGIIWRLYKKNLPPQQSEKIILRWLKKDRILEKISEELFSSLDNSKIPVEYKEIILELILKIREKYLRPIQKEALINIVYMLIEWKNEWLIKIPTWWGKTRLFWEIISALWLKTLILIPRNVLSEQTKSELEDIWLESEIHLISSNNWELSEKQFKDCIESLKQKKKWIIISTYQSLVSIKDNEILLKKLFDEIGMVIRDEAHRSLWDTTQTALDSILTWSPHDNIIEEIQSMINTKKIHLLFTATPDLLNKSVKDSYETIVSASIARCVREGILIFPRHINIWIGNVNTDKTKITQELLDSLSDKFVTEDWKYVYEALTDSYIQAKKENWWYLPWVGFCSTIEQAEKMTQYLKGRWIKAVRVTSNNKSYKNKANIEDIKRKLNTWEIDIILTVTKVAEWFDLPTLRAAIWFYPSQSTAKRLQWTWRIMRVLNDNSLAPKNHENTVIIEPTCRERYNYRQESKQPKPQGDRDEKENRQSTWQKIWKVVSIHQLLYNIWEIDASFLIEDGVHLEKYKLKKDWTVEINGRLYTCVIFGMTTQNSRIPCSWYVANKILGKLRNENPEWFEKNVLKWKWISGTKTVDLYDLEELLKILPDYTEWYQVNKDGIVDIDWVTYTAIFETMNPDNSKLPCSWFIARKVLGKVKKENPEWFEKNVLDKKWLIWNQKINLYNLEELLKILDKDERKYKVTANGTVDIDWIIYTTVNRDTNITNSVLSCSWIIIKKILDNMKITNPEWFEKNGLKWKWISGTKTVDLYRLDELLKILPDHTEWYQLNKDGIVDIDWVTYTAIFETMNPDNSKLPCSWFIAKKILGEFKKDNPEWFEKNGLRKKWISWVHRVDLYRLDKLLKILGNMEILPIENDGTVIIEGETYTAITKRMNAWNSKLPCDWRKINDILNILRKENPRWFEENVLKWKWIRKGKYLDLYKFNELLKIIENYFK